MEGEEEGVDITPVKDASATPSRQSSQQKQQSQSQSQPQTPQIIENSQMDEGAIMTPTNDLQDHNYEQYLDQAVANSQHLPRLDENGGASSKNHSQLQKEAHLKMPLISQP